MRAGIVAVARSPAFEWIGNAAIWTATQIRRTALVMGFDERTAKIVRACIAAKLEVLAVTLARATRPTAAYVIPAAILVGRALS